MSGSVAQTGSDRISPTAHYTGYVWVRNGLADPAFATVEGRVLFTALQPATSAIGWLGKPNMESYLLARHQLIDHLLTEAIEQRGVSQVIEVAAGLSGRGSRFTRRYGDALTYLEADLPAMADRKRRLLDRVGPGSAGHTVVDIDALRDSGTGSLAQIAERLDPHRGLVIITEGLINYFGRDDVTGMWRRFARVLSGFDTGRYFSDLHLARSSSGVISEAAATLLSVFVRGRVHLHFANVAEAVGELRAAGFSEATLHSPASFVNRLEHCGAPGARLVRVIEAGV